MAADRIRIRLEAYDHRSLDTSARDIVDSAKRTAARVRGPIRCALRIAAQNAATVTWNGQTVARAPDGGRFAIADLPGAAPAIGALACVPHPPQEHLGGGQPYAVLTCTTDRPALLDVTFTEPNGLRRRAVTPGQAATRHRVRIDFLRPGVAYTFTVRATDLSGRAHSEAVKTKPAP